MKKKTNSMGQPYIIFEDDRDLEKLALSIIALLPKHSGTINKPLKMRLWDCAFDYLDTAPKSSVIFKRCQTITNELAEERVMALLTEVINKIVKEAKAEHEKMAVMSWDKSKTRKTKNGILVRHSSNGKFVGLKTLTEVLVGKLEELEQLMKAANTNIEDISWADFNKLVEFVKTDHSFFGKGQVKDKFKSIKVAFEDILTEKEITTNKK